MTEPLSPEYMPELSLDFVDLFCGVGGVAAGLIAAGFHHRLGVDQDWWMDAGTQRELGAEQTFDQLGLPFFKGRVQDHAWMDFLTRAPTLGWASTPCQPSSLTGLRAGPTDERDGYGVLFDAIDELRRRDLCPQWFISEQVTGATKHKRDCRGPDTCPGCAWNEIILPGFQQRFDWVEHRVLETADFGLAQRRRRVFIVAGPGPIEWPKPTHSFASLVHDKWIDRSYWSEHDIDPIDGVLATAAERNAVDAIAMGTVAAALHGSPLAKLGSPSRPRWRTLQDVAPDLDHHAVREEGNMRGSRPELMHMPSVVVAATDYKGTNYGRQATTGVYPSRSSDSLWLAAGVRRTPVKLARTLQGFPSGWPICGPARSRWVGTGNAVPPILAAKIGQSIHQAVQANRQEK